eukprot:4171610-Prorocentrum_lima.AAC.1
MELSDEANKKLKAALQETFKDECAKMKTFIKEASSVDDVQSAVDRFGEFKVEQQQGTSRG